MSDDTAPHPYHPYHALAGCQLKMFRAHEHAKVLHNAIDEFVGREPYRIVHDFQSEPGYSLGRFEVRERPPLWWSPAIGDIVHNIRSALDHLTWQLVIRNGRNPDSGRPQFPIFVRDPFDPDAHDSTEQARHALKSWKGHVKGIHKADVEIIKRLQPYYGPGEPNDHPLARINQLSNWDKHREFHFVAQSFADYRPRVSAKDARLRLLYLKPRGETVKDGEVIARFEVLSTGANPKLDYHLKVIFQIAFGKGNPLEGLGVKQTLPAVGRYVSEIIAAFKERFDHQDFSPPPELQTPKG